MKLHGSLLAESRTAVETRFGTFELFRFRNLSTGAAALALVRGDPAEPRPLLARVHSSCVTSEVFGGRDCDCAAQLEAAVAALAEAGRGVLFYLMQEGRGAGFVAKARDRMLVQASGERLTTFEAFERLGLPPDGRDYREVRWMRRALGIRAPLCLLTHNPDKVAGLERAKVPIARTQALPHRRSPWNLHYVAAKARSGHALATARARLRRARLPEPVAWLEPAPVPELPRFVRVARYLLPLAPRECEVPRWFRVHVFVDGVSGRARVVLSHRRRAGAEPLVSVQTQRLEDRLPLRRPGARARAWERRFAAIAERGAGSVLFLDPDEPARPDAATRRLAAAAEADGPP